MRIQARRVFVTAAFSVALAALTAPAAGADNTRLNNSVVANVYTVQHQAGCTTDIRINPALQLAAQRQADDLLASGSDLPAILDALDGGVAEPAARHAGYQPPATEVRRAAAG